MEETSHKTHTPTNLERRKRLVYRASHRGMRELDITFGAWVSHLDASDSLSDSRLARLERLLERSEPDLLALLCDCEFAQKNNVEDKEEQELMRELRQFLSSPKNKSSKNKYHKHKSPKNKSLGEK